MRDTGALPVPRRAGFFTPQMIARTGHLCEIKPPSRRLPRGRRRGGCLSARPVFAIPREKQAMIAFARFAGRSPLC